MHRTDEDVYEDKVFKAMAKANVVNKVKYEAKSADGSQPFTLFYTAALKTSAAAVTAACVTHFEVLSELLKLKRKDPPKKALMKGLKNLPWLDEVKHALDFEFEIFAVRLMMSHIGRLSRNLKSGDRTPDRVLQLVQLYKDSLPCRSPNRDDSPEPTRAFSRPRPASKVLESSSTTLRDRVFAMYKLPVAQKGGPDDIVLLSDSDNDKEESLGSVPSTPPQRAVPGKVAWKDYVDYASQRHMRLHESGSLEPGEMFVSTDCAFQKCRFVNGDVVTTEFPALTSALAPPKAKTAARKRPAAAFPPAPPAKSKRQKQSTDEEGDEEEEEEVEQVEEEVVPVPEAPAQPPQWMPGAKAGPAGPDGKIRSWSFSNGMAQGACHLTSAKDQTYAHLRLVGGGKKWFLGGLSCGYKNHCGIIESVISEMLRLPESEYEQKDNLKREFLLRRDRLKAGQWIEDA